MGEVRVTQAGAQAELERDSGEVRVTQFGALAELAHANGEVRASQFGALAELARLDGEIRASQFGVLVELQAGGRPKFGTGRGGIVVEYDRAWITEHWRSISMELRQPSLSQETFAAASQDTVAPGVLESAASGTGYWTNTLDAILGADVDPPIATQKQFGIILGHWNYQVKYEWPQSFPSRYLVTTDVDDRAMFEAAMAVSGQARRGCSD